MERMDWLRRNWPDLLIGVALVAVIAGIIATLISGGSFFPVGQGARGGTNPPAAQSGPVTTPSQGAQTGTTSPSTGATGGQTDTQGSQGAAQTTTEPGIAVLPPAGTTSGTTSGATSTATEEPAAPAASTEEPAAEEPAAADVTPLPPTGTSTTPAATQGAATPAAPTAPAATATAAPVAASASAEEASYRVAVGAFGNADNADRLAQQFQAAGYPVLLGTQGDLTIVLVGPYASESEARRVADQVRAGAFGVADPVVHRFEPEAPSGAGAAATASAPTPSTPAAPAAPAPAASGAGRYLQVGAYANRESSLPQRERLEGLGFDVTEVQEGTLVKLLVGPYQGGALSEAKSRLTAEGIEHFARGL